MDDPTAASTTSARSRRWWPFIKWTMFLVVLYFIGQRSVALWQQSPSVNLRVNFLWLIPAVVLYLLGSLPSVWFWRAMLTRMGQRVGWYAAIRAYYAGSIGKYIPGKALVLVLRGSLLKEAGASPLFAGVAAVYETLVFMWSGAALTVALAPATLPLAFWEQMPTALQGLRHQGLLLPVLVVVITLLTTPFSAWLFTLVGRKALPPDATTPQPPVFTAGLMVQGAFITALGWSCHALSLGCTLQSLSSHPFDLRMFPVWLASVCVSTVGGFVILIAPGGIGVREWLLVEMLKDQPTIGPALAVVVAWLLRAIWFTSEVTAAGVLYAVKPRSSGSSERGT
jgi:glycosyltransferase 2 family protein